MFSNCAFSAHVPLTGLLLDSAPQALMLANDTVFAIGDSGYMYVMDIPGNRLLHKQYVAVPLSPSSVKRLGNGVVVSSTDGLWHVARDKVEHVYGSQCSFDVVNNITGKSGVVVLVNSSLMFYPISLSSSQPSPQEVMPFPSSSAPLWSVPVSCKNGTVVASGKYAFIVCNDSLSSVDMEKRFVQWARPMENIDGVFVPSVSASSSPEQIPNEQTNITDYVVVRSGYSLKTIDAVSGQTLWDTEFEGVPMLVFAGQNIFAWTTDGTLHMISVNGSNMGTVDIGEISCLTVYNNHILVCASENDAGMLQSYSAQGKLEYVFKTGGKPMIIDPEGNRIAYITDARKVQIAYSDIVCTIFEPPDNVLVGNAEVLAKGSVYIADDALKKVDIFLDDDLLWSGSSAVWEYYIDPRGIGDGRHVLSCSVSGANSSEAGRDTAHISIIKNSEILSDMQVSYSPKSAKYGAGAEVRITVTNEYGRNVNGIAVYLNGKFISENGTVNSPFTITLNPGLNRINITRPGYRAQELMFIAEEQGALPLMAIGLGLLVIAAIVLFFIMRGKKEDKGNKGEGSTDEENKGKPVAPPNPPMFAPSLKPVKLPQNPEPNSKSRNPLATLPGQPSQ